MPISTKEMACHTWALSGTPANGEQVNHDYIALMDRIGAHYEYGGRLLGKTMAAVRQETMQAILRLCERRTEALRNEVFVCGGFREGQVCPEHVWLEDHTTQRSYDTFIDQDVRMVKKVGQPGRAFKPPCEASAFEPDEIARVKVNGYTAGQLASLPG